MNSRERVQTALNHRQPDRVPLQLWLTPEVAKELKLHIGVGDSEEDILDALDIDVRWLLVDYIGPECQIYPDGSRENEFGMRFRAVSNRFGSYDEFLFHPLADAQTLSDVENYRWPDPDWWDYSSIARKIAVADRIELRWLGVGYASLFERAWGLIGFEKWLQDLVMNPELVEAVLDHLLQFYLEQTSRILEAGGDRIDMIYIADDLGSQNNLLISPALWHQYLKERWRSFIETVKARFGNHLKFHFHSCGAVSKLIPDLIEMGIDILNPIQPRATGMQPQDLKAAYGDDICFSGGFDIQQILPNGSVEQVRSEAFRLTNILGHQGGYIASPAHSVQPDTPPENILSMIEGFKNTETCRSSTA